MVSANATNFYGKPGVAEWSDLRFFSACADPDKDGATYIFPKCARVGKLAIKMQSASRQFSFTYRYWYPVAALVACAHLRI
jgi:hypothetical protein